MSKTIMNKTIWYMHSKEKEIVYLLGYFGKDEKLKKDWKLSDTMLEKIRNDKELRDTILEKTNAILCEIQPLYANLC